MSKWASSFLYKVLLISLLIGSHTYFTVLEHKLCKMVLFLILYCKLIQLTFFIFYFYVLPNVSRMVWTSSGNSSPIHLKTWHTLQKVYFCGRKTYPNSPILCHWRRTASFSILHLYIPFCMKSIFFCTFTPCILLTLYHIFCRCNAFQRN